MTDHIAGKKEKKVVFLFHCGLLVVSLLSLAFIRSDELANEIFK